MEVFVVRLWPSRRWRSLLLDHELSGDGGACCKAMSTPEMAVFTVRL